MTDLSKLSLDELHSLQAKVIAEIAHRQSAEKAKAEEEIRLLASKFGLKVQIGASGRAPKAKRPVAAKYRHPSNPSLTWTGRGRSPAWVVEWKNQHGSLTGITV